MKCTEFIFTQRKKKNSRRLFCARELVFVDEKVLKAINQVPRHLFLESVFEDFAYEDRAFPIAANQTISHPSTVAEQTELLEVPGKGKNSRNWYRLRLSNCGFGHHECFCLRR